MAFGEVQIGDARIHLSAYCPRDALTELYCELVITAARECLDGITEAEVLRIIEQRCAARPGVAELVAAVRAGERPERLADIGTYPVDPRNAAAEAEMVGRLRGMEQHDRR